MLGHLCDSLDEDMDDLDDYERGIWDPRDPRD